MVALSGGRFGQDVADWVPTGWRLMQKQ